MNETLDKWDAGDAYETFMGKWSRLVASEFLEWLAPAPRAHWLEVGCGTGALTQAICRHADPASLLACDPSPALVSFARNSTGHSSVEFAVAQAEDLPRRDGGYDLVVSGLVLNFLPHLSNAVRWMTERIRPGGVLAAYVWDYAQGMEFLRIFWDEAVALDPSAAQLDEARRFPICQPGALRRLFAQAGLETIEGTTLQIATIFPDFDAYWRPFLGRTGPAPSYVDSLSRDARRRLRLRLEERLTRSPDGTIRLAARALGVRGRMPI